MIRLHPGHPARVRGVISLLVYDTFFVALLELISLTGDWWGILTASMLTRLAMAHRLAYRDLTYAPVSQYTSHYG